MAEIFLNSYKNIIAKIYAYTEPGVEYNIGWLKIGYTERPVDERIKEQTLTARIKFKVEWIEIAPFDEKNNKQLKDVDFHNFLVDKYKIERDKNSVEWFKISPELALKYFHEFSAGKSARKNSVVEKSYTLREEQNNAVDLTLEYFLEEKTPREFLWNAKPRFGKTLSTYDFILNSEVKKILIVTNRPSISNSWYDDFKDYVSWRTNFKFVSTTDSLKKKTNLSYEDYCKLYKNFPIIAFVSLQDLKGSIYFGGEFNKLEWIKNLHFDLLVVDESHEGVDTDKTFEAFKNIRRDFTLFLSGTPFKALADKKFNAAQIFNWSYLDEQNAKINWRGEIFNPYADMPKMNLFSYRIDKIFEDKIFAAEDKNFLYDLNDFFETDGNGNFLHKEEVKKFLDALTMQEKFPFSTKELRAELKHTFWLMYRVDGVKAMAKLLQAHEIFKDYKIIIAAGDGTISEFDEKQNEKSFDKVKAAIANFDKTITLSVGQLTTGVTIPEWSTVLMLNNLKSATQYLQAAFRAQNPCSVKIDAEIISRKENCYVFDFNPVRALEIYNEYAKSLSGSNGKISAETVENLLKFFPAFAENDNGRMVELDAKEIMSLPQKIAAKQAVDCCFMYNGLFNIDRVFNSDAVKKIINKMHGENIDNNKNSFGDEIKPPKKISRPPRPKPDTPPNEIVAEIIKNLADNGYKVSDALKKKIAELVNQNVDAEIIQEKIINEIIKNQTENDFRAKLRTFAATIPSFIMAYGDELLTLANFDSYIDAETFLQVTGITLEEFRLLREEEIFSENVFNAAVAEFLARMQKYADYFDETFDKDIFDFIPPQKTSQVFTPRFIVQKMVDALEIQNPNIFDNPAQKFFDPYIKSGLYIAEIVKRLYKNDKICAAFPDNQQRLKHILENQVFGCAPNEIIFRIATRYIFGNAQNISQKNFYKIDTLQVLREGNISDLLKNIFSVKVIILNKDRVKKFGEVFTPPDIVNTMLACEDIQAEIKNLHSRFFEPATGEAAFLSEILRQKLNFHVPEIDAAGDFKYKMLWILSALYGIEIQPDNVETAKNNLKNIFCEHYKKICGFPLEENSDLHSAMKTLLEWNIIEGDALNEKNISPPKFAIFQETDDLHLAQCKICTYDNFFKQPDPQNLFKNEKFNPAFSVTKIFDLLNIHRTEFEESDIVDIADEFKNIIVTANPPYQGETSGDNKTFAKPVYNLFLESFWQACNRVMMIHPARCLFNAGATPNAFNKKLLNDEHIKVILYEPNCKNIFPDADIKGGVAVTYRDQNKIFGKIGVYTQFPVLNLLVHDVFTVNKFFKSFNEIMHGQTLYKLSIKAYEDFPALLEPIYTRNDMALRTNAIERFSELFFDKKLNDGNEYIQIWGREDNQRVCKWIRRDYIVDIPELHNYKVFLAAANNVGNLGEKLVTPLVGLPLVGLPLVGSTQTFISVGDFHTEAEAVNCLKYIKTKFARALLGVLKITQHNPPEKWKYVPLQDFTNDSDIDWSRSVAEIDLQLYQKYNLSQEEIDFIETKVRAME